MLWNTHVFGIECSDLKVCESHGTGGGDFHLLILSFKHVSNVVCPVLLTLALYGQRASHNTVDKELNTAAGPVVERLILHLC